MSEALQITIQEWVEEYGLNVTDEAVSDLIESIKTSLDMEIYQTGFTLGHPTTDPKDGEIKKLKRRIDELERFIEVIGLKNADIQSYSVGNGYIHVGPNKKKVYVRHEW